MKLELFKRLNKKGRKIEEESNRDQKDNNRNPAHFLRILAQQEDTKCEEYADICRLIEVQRVSSKKGKVR